MRVVFFGTSAFAVPSLEQLVASGHTVMSCITQPDRRQGRGLQAEPSPVKHAAQRLRLPVLQSDKPTAPSIAALNPEIGIVMAYGQIIPPDVLAVPLHGMIGVHPSLLPRYRGAAPVAGALLAGDTTTGVTIFRLVPALDAGDILRQQTIPITPEESCEQLTQRLAILGAQELVRTLEEIAGGHVTAVPQDEAAATYAHKLTKAQGHIDWRMPAAQIVRLIRATQPWPGAATLFKGQPLKLLSAHVVASSRATPGTVIRVDGEHIHVASGEGAVVLTDVQLAGRRRMRVKEFLAGHAIHVGDQLGAW